MMLSSTKFILENWAAKLKNSYIQYISDMVLGHSCSYSSSVKKKKVYVPAKPKLFLIFLDIWNVFQKI